MAVLTQKTYLYVRLGMFQKWDPSQIIANQCPSFIGQFWGLKFASMHMIDVSSSITCKMHSDPSHCPPRANESILGSIPLIWPTQFLAIESLHAAEIQRVVGGLILLRHFRSHMQGPWPFRSVGQRQKQGVPPQNQQFNFPAKKWRRVLFSRAIQQQPGVSIHTAHAHWVKSMKPEGTHRSKIIQVLPSCCVTTVAWILELPGVIRRFLGFQKTWAPRNLEFKGSILRSGDVGHFC